MRMDLSKREPNTLNISDTFSESFLKNILRYLAEFITRPEFDTVCWRHENKNNMRTDSFLEEFSGPEFLIYTSIIAPLKVESDDPAAFIENPYGPENGQLQCKLTIGWKNNEKQPKHIERMLREKFEE